MPYVPEVGCIIGGKVKKESTLLDDPSMAKDDPSLPPVLSIKEGTQPHRENVYQLQGKGKKCRR